MSCISIPVLKLHCKNKKKKKEKNQNKTKQSFCFIWNFLIVSDITWHLTAETSIELYIGGNVEITSLSTLHFFTALWKITKKWWNETFNVVWCHETCSAINSNRWTRCSLSALSWEIFCVFLRVSGTTVCISDWGLKLQSLGWNIKTVYTHISVV